jgi:hypothetical protein
MSPLERTLYDLLARANADPFYTTIPLFVLRPRYEDDGTVKDSASFEAIQTRINQASSCLQLKAGKGGAAVTFLMPTGDTDKPNISGPQMKFTYTARVQEHPVLNWGARGTQISAEEIALHTLQLFHLCMLNGRNCLAADPQTLTPAEKDGLLVYDVRLLQQGGLTPPGKCALPIIAPRIGTGATEITITCATAGAAIYYTTDGSYPFAENDEATLYNAPFALGAAAPCTLRVAAQKAGLQQSDVAEGYYT